MIIDDPKSTMCCSCQMTRDEAAEREIVLSIRELRRLPEEIPTFQFGILGGAIRAMLRNGLLDCRRTQKLYFKPLDCYHRLQHVQKESSRKECPARMLCIADEYKRRALDEHSHHDGSLWCDLWGFPFGMVLSNTVRCKPLKMLHTAAF